MLNAKAETKFFIEEDHLISLTKGDLKADLAKQTREGRQTFIFKESMITKPKHNYNRADLSHDNQQDRSPPLAVRETIRHLDFFQSGNVNERKIDRNAERWNENTKDL
jgi:hypothetical protein